MVDIIITIAMIIISAILGLCLHLENAAIQALIELIPLFIITVRLWCNKPRNYVYLMGIINRNIKYSMTIKLEECEIDQQFFIKLCKALKKFSKTESGKEINQNMGDFLWKSYIEVDACLIEITYNLESENLYIETKSKEKFKNFIYDVDSVIEKILNVFSENKNRYNNELINIKVEYLNRKSEHKLNPFINKFFDKFKDIKIDLRYRGANGSKFVIQNDGISVSADRLKNIKMDIKKEMLLF